MTLLCSQMVFSQKKIYSTFEGDLPSIDLNHSNFASQQLRFGLGYAVADDFGTSLNFGCGLLGRNDIASFKTKSFYSFGVSANYMFLHLRNNYHIGMEALCDYNLSFAQDNNDHLSITGAFKLQFPLQTYVKIGWQNRFMTDNASLLVCTFGFKIR